jgi:DNA-binding NarL/FixJ family response regulator
LLGGNDPRSNAGGRTGRPPRLRMKGTAVAVSTDVGVALVVDPDEEAREATTQLFEQAGFEVVAVSSGEEALEIARATPPSVVILEIPLEGVSGYEVCRTLREALGPELPIVFVTGARTEPYDRVAGLLVGADDYVVKPYAADELLARARRLVQRAQPLTASVVERLTKRELEILQLLARGLTQAQIAERLVISPKTVGTHIEHILPKLGVRSRAQAVAIAFREELVETG